MQAVTEQNKNLEKKVIERRIILLFSLSKAHKIRIRKHFGKNIKAEEENAANYLFVYFGILFKVYSIEWL